MLHPINRTSALRDLQSFLEQKNQTAGFCYLRGRRRVGKSTLLTQFEKAHPGQVFYFMGRLDEKSTQSLKRCAESWDSFTGKTELSRLKSGHLSWDEFFKAVTAFSSILNRPVLLAFDEIQWIAREKSGFLGALKEHWLNLEPMKNIRIVLCGSSNKFFHQMTGGEEKLIRGLKTRADIWLRPLNLSEIKSHYKLKYTDEELLLAYMFFGGIPYYWNQIEPTLFFTQGINRSCFTPSSIFLEEFSEMLSLEFQKNSIKTLSQIFSQFKGTGVTAAQIAEKARLAPSTVGDLLEKLENYSLVSRKTPLFSKPKEIQRGSLYYCRDFYLNFYFRILSKYKTKISRNRESEMLFATLLQTSSNSLYLPDYTGPMFEILLQHILESSEERHEPIFQKLNLEQVTFDVGFHWDKSTQFDLILHNASDRVYRFIECKWTRDAKQILECITSFSRRIERYEIPIQKVICLNHTPSDSLRAAAKKHDVTLITPTDLIG